MQHQQLSSPILVFSSAAPSDTVLLAQWEKHLLPLQGAGQITVWSEWHLRAGIPRAKLLHEWLDQAQVVVFLLSPDFFDCDECMALMEQALSGHARVIPLLLRPVYWETSKLADLPCLPANSQFVATWDDQDYAFYMCVDGLRQLLGLPEVSPQSRQQAHGEYANQPNFLPHPTSKPQRVPTSLQEEQAEPDSHVFNPTLIPSPIVGAPNLKGIPARPQRLDVIENKTNKGHNQKIKVLFVILAILIVLSGGAAYVAFQNIGRVMPSSQVSSKPEPLCVDSQNKSREETGNPNPNLVAYPPVTVPNGCVLIVNGYQGCVNSQCWNDGSIMAFRTGSYRLSLIEGAYDLVATSGGKHLFCSYAAYLRSQGNVLQITQPLSGWGSC